MNIHIEEVKDADIYSACNDFGKFLKEQLEELDLTNCANWNIDRLKRYLDLYQLLCMLFWEKGKFEVDKEKK